MAHSAGRKPHAGTEAQGQMNSVAIVASARFENDFRLRRFNQEFGRFNEERSRP
jgi:hypothetical protein